jgi:hypothetical protein
VPLIIFLALVALTAASIFVIYGRPYFVKDARAGRRPP